MIVRYRLIQFHADPVRAEGRNVAVIAWNEDRTCLRALGVDPFGRVDPTGFERLLPQTLRSSAWVYAEWAERWAGLAQRGEGHVERLLAELDRIEEIGAGHWSASEGGEVDVEPSVPRRSPWEEVDPALSAVRGAADALYERLVAGGMVGVLPAAFLDAVEAALSISETRYHEGFVQDETVAVSEGEESETLLFFPYLVDDTQRTGVKLVCFNGPPWETAVAAVNDAILTFDLAVAAGFLRRDRCIALVDPAAGHCQGLAVRLARSATLVDVTAPDAASRLGRLVQGEGKRSR